MRTFAARFFDVAADLAFSENVINIGVNIKSNITIANMVARNITSFENRKAVTHHRIRKNR
jgi:hypothetical protein